jgi:tRNA modification GTPase
LSDTIFALSSGRPPAAIAVIRISGPAAFAAAAGLAGTLPADRRAALRTLRDDAGDILDRALVLTFAGPATVTGEDLVELHLHGGRAIVVAVEAALASYPGVRLARPGEFTRRALENGRIDVTQAEGLADLLEAETEAQRRIAQAASDGAWGQKVAQWLDVIAQASALVEAELDYGDEDDVSTSRRADLNAPLRAVTRDMATLLAQPTVERLRDGVTVVFAGPPNAGKSSLFNALLGRDAAIVTPIAGTTRDVLEAQVVRRGMPFRLIDTAGLAERTHDAIEMIGIDRARSVASQADILLWLGDSSDCPTGAVLVSSKADVHTPQPGSDVIVAATDTRMVGDLWAFLTMRAATLLHVDGNLAIRQNQREAVRAAHDELIAAGLHVDPLLTAEHLRIATTHLAGVLGRNATETMLDALFGRFCLGK